MGHLQGEDTQPLAKKYEDGGRSPCPPSNPAPKISREREDTYGCLVELYVYIYFLKNIDILQANQP